MGSALGSLDTYDYLTFVFLVIVAIAFFSIAMFILGLPGKIAIKRRHPHAEGVKLMGWAGFLAVIPWIHALIWAFHDSVTVDVRRFPNDEKKEVEAQIKRLSGEKTEIAERLAEQSEGQYAHSEGRPEDQQQGGTKDPHGRKGGSA
ncbi:MAG: DUF3302 domain-containing protein [Pseudomonadota bacterium]